jgi:hypothetical protein
MYIYKYTLCTHMRDYCDGEKIDCEDLNAFTRSQHPDDEKVVLGMLCVCTHVWMDGRMGEWMDMPLSSGWRLDGFCSYSIFESLSNIGRRPMDTNHSNAKNSGNSDGPRETKW